MESFLGDGSVPLDADTLAAGLAAVTSPGRLEIVGVGPTVLVDGAHNPHGARALVEAIRESFTGLELGLVVGVLGDKDVRGVLETLRPLTATLWATQSASERAVDAATLAALADDLGFDVRTAPDADSAVRAARDWAADRARAVLVTGSLTLVAEARQLAREEGWHHS